MYSSDEISYVFCQEPFASVLQYKQQIIMGLEPMHIALHQTQENRKKMKEREKEKGGMGHQMGHLPHFRM